MPYVTDPSLNNLSAIVLDFDMTVTAKHTGGLAIWDCQERNNLMYRDYQHYQLLKAMYDSPQDYIKPGFLEFLHNQLSKGLPIFIATRGMPYNAIHMINTAYLQWCEHNNIQPVSQTPLTYENTFGRGTKYQYQASDKRSYIAECTIDSIGSDYKQALLSIVASKLRQKGISANQALFIDDEHDKYQNSYRVGNRNTAHQLGFQVLVEHDVMYSDGIRRPLELANEYLFEYHQFFHKLKEQDRVNLARIHQRPVTSQYKIHHAYQPASANVQPQVQQSHQRSQYQQQGVRQSKERTSSQQPQHAYQQNVNSNINKAVNTGYTVPAFQEVDQSITKNGRTLGYNILGVQDKSEHTLEPQRKYQVCFGDYNSTISFVRNSKLVDQNGQPLSVYKNPASNYYYINCSDLNLLKIMQDLEQAASDYRFRPR